MAALLALLLSAPAQAAATDARSADGGTVAAIREAGELRCGLVMEPDDWNLIERHGDLDAMGQEFCKAVGAVILGAEAKIAFQPYMTEEDALAGLARGESDLVANVTPSAVGHVEHVVQFSPVVFYDSQGFLVARTGGIARPEDLAGKTVCVIGSTEAEDTADVWLRARKIAYLPSPFSEQGEMDGALAGGRCAAETGTISKLAFSRMQLRSMDDFVFLPQRLTIDPLALAYRQGDARFGAIVDWTVNALIQAEASGVGRDTAATASDAGDPAAKRLLGTDFVAGRALGLDARWAVRAIAAVGNYGEIYDRTVGEQSSFRLPRGMNALWTEGGLMRPLPVR